jgi:hypothetical protein
VGVTLPSGTLVLTLATATAAPRSTVRPGSRPDSGSGEDDDHLRHIICLICYPAFDQALEAPHDATCLCGKLLRAGEKRGDRDAAQCILCDELREHHYSTAHPHE